MKQLQISDTEKIKVDDTNTDEFGNIGLTIDQSRKYLNFLIDKKAKAHPLLLITKETIDDFIDFGIDIELNNTSIYGITDQGKTSLLISQAKNYINQLFDKQENIELETNNDRGDFIFTKQEIDEFVATNFIHKSKKL